MNWAYCRRGWTSAWAATFCLATRSADAGTDRQRTGAVDAAARRRGRTVSAGRAVVLRGDARRLPLPRRGPPTWSTRYALLQTPRVHRRRRRARADRRRADPGGHLETLWACAAEWGAGPETGRIDYSSTSAISTQITRSGAARTRRKHVAGLRPTGLGRAKTETSMPPNTRQGLPWRYALGCIDRLGLILRAEIIWDKPNALPESVTDRCRSSHEYIFHLTGTTPLLRRHRRDSRTARSRVTPVPPP